MSCSDNGTEPPRHTFRALSRVPNLVHAVFTRHGGVSAPPFASLNASWSIGDSPSAVQENISRMKATLRTERVVASPQVHGDGIHLVEESLLAKLQVRTPTLVTPPGDALVTNLRGVGLMIKIADCQAVFLVDPVRAVIANVHCGWRGSVQGILPKAVECMKLQFGSRSEDILAGISPSLGPCCAEFRNYERELPESFHAFQVRPRYFDFWAISRSQLLSAGLALENIEVAGKCTVCGKHDFFSYRGEGTTGRMAAVIAWKEDC